MLSVIKAERWAAYNRCMKRLRTNPAGYSKLTLSQARQYLGLDPTATKNQAKSAFRAMAKIHHPDVGGDAEKFAIINEAYDVLMGELVPRQEASAPSPSPRPSSRPAARPAPRGAPSSGPYLPVVRGPDVISVLQQLQAIANMYPPSKYGVATVAVASRGGMYTSSLLSLIVDTQNGRDILEGPAPEPEPSVWDED